ncbi:MAG: 6-phosphogluconolactonase [Bacteriovoracaceae bacterium]|nr:6-phosphogluconolactonase [Bacteriovoracaceae bacterium]
MEIIQNTDKLQLDMLAHACFEQSINRLLEDREHLNLGISGGSGVLGLFQLLGENKNIPWQLINIFMVDERFVPITHPDSNALQAQDQFINTLMKKGVLKSKNWHPFTYDKSLKDCGVSSYNKQLNELGGKLDIIVLGMGEDGHIASLFPRHASINNKNDKFIVVSDSPKPPQKRVSASRQLLLNSQVALLLFFGPTKQKAYDLLNNKSTSVLECPAKIVTQIPNSYIFTDLNSTN